MYINTNLLVLISLMVLKILFPKALAMLAKVSKLGSFNRHTLLEADSSYFFACFDII